MAPEGYIMFSFESDDESKREEIAKKMIEMKGVKSVDIFRESHWGGVVRYKTESVGTTTILERLIRETKGIEKNSVNTENVVKRFKATERGYEVVNDF